LNAFEGVLVLNHPIVGQKFNLRIIVSPGVLIPKAHLLINCRLKRGLAYILRSIDESFEFSLRYKDSNH
jgi:hypothetical protein